MLLTMFLLAVLYLGFLAFLLSMQVSQIVIILFIGGFMFLQYFFSDRMILASMGAKIVTESEAPRLHDMVRRLCQNANLPMPGIAVVKTRMPNAFATGRNQNNAVVAVTTGIMERLNESELEAVLAHELTHVKNRDMMVMTGSLAGWACGMTLSIPRPLLFNLVAIVAGDVIVNSAIAEFSKEKEGKFGFFLTVRPSMPPCC